MALLGPKFSRIIHRCFHSLAHTSPSHFIASHQSIEDSFKTAVANKSYQQIPYLLATFKSSCDNPNPFSFLSAYPLNLINLVIDEILQSFTPLRPRSQAKVAYDCLLSFSLQSHNPFPIAFSVMQRTLCSGCSPAPQIHLLLSSAWIVHRFHCQHAANISSEMKSIGYCLDFGTCNYLISSLCVVDKLDEAVDVLQGMVEAGCVLDAESYSLIIDVM